MVNDLEIAKKTYKNITSVGKNEEGYLVTLRSSLMEIEKDTNVLRFDLSDELFYNQLINYVNLKD